MDGFVVVAQTVADGEHWLVIETAATRSWCPDCGVAGVGNGRRRVKVRDLPIAGVATVLVWSKRTFRCPEALCRAWVVVRDVATDRWSGVVDRAGSSRDLPACRRRLGQRC